MSGRRKQFPAATLRYFFTITQCANNPDKPGVGCVGYKCPMWIFNNGYFDGSGKEIDHKQERADGGTDDTTNLQALCPCCHSFKTRKYMKNKGIPTDMYDMGARFMETETEANPAKAEKPARSALHDLKMRDAPAKRATTAQAKRKKKTSSPTPSDVEMIDVPPDQKKPRGAPKNTNSPSGVIDLTGAGRGRKRSDCRVVSKSKKK